MLINLPNCNMITEAMTQITKFVVMRFEYGVLKIFFSFEVAKLIIFLKISCFKVNQHNKNTAPLIHNYHLNFLLRKLKGNNDWFHIYISPTIFKYARRNNSLYDTNIGYFSFRIVFCFYYILLIPLPFCKKYKYTSYLKRQKSSYDYISSFAFPLF